MHISTDNLGLQDITATSTTQMHPYGMVVRAKDNGKLATDVSMASYATCTITGTAPYMGLTDTAAAFDSSYVGSYILFGGTHTTVAVLSNFKVSQPIGGYSKRTTAWNPWNVYDAYANPVTPVNSSGTSLFLGTNFLFTPSGASVPAGTLPLQTDGRYTRQPDETYNTGANANFLCRHTYNVAAASAVTGVASSSSNYGGLFATYYCYQFEIVGN
jgi:hypothetical protein